MWPFKKKIKLTAITDVPHLKDMFPIVSAEDRLPAWYRNIPLTYKKGVCPVPHSITNKGATIKGCTGVNDLMRTGFILPAWEDISIVIYPDGKFSSVGAQTNPPALGHDAQQMPPTMQHYTVIKLVSPWCLEGDSTQYYVTPAVYHTSLGRDFFMPSGVVSYEYQSATHVFIAATPKKEPYEILIKAGEPLLHIVPLTGKKITLEVKFIPNHKRLIARNFFLLHGYQRYVNWMKRKRDAS